MAETASGLSGSGGLATVAGGNVASSLISGAFGLGSTAISASAQNYATDQRRHATDTAYKMWNRDYEIANSMGLYHPTQLAAVSAPGSGTEYIRLAGRGLARVQRTKGSSVFG